jgi:hypothetical protein
MPADHLTKLLPRELHQQFVCQLRLDSTQNQIDNAGSDAAKPS